MTAHLCDSNVWLALVLSRHVHHDAVHSWFESVEDPDSVLFCRATQQSFVRLLSSTAVLAPYGNPPLTNREAWRTYLALLADDRVMMQPLEPTALEGKWKLLAAHDKASPKLWMDAYLAAFAITGNLRMITTDRGFRQFAELDLCLIGAN